MYIEQLKNNQKSLLLYLPFALAFLGFMTVNIIYSFAADIDADQAITQLINQFGKTPAFILMVFPLSILCIALLGWVKIVHQQSIRSLTTARKKIDWKRVFFSFTVWAIFVIASLLINYWISPEDFEFTFRPVPFFTLAIIAIILIPLQTSFEEYFFRGYLMQGLGLAFKNRWAPLIITSVLFGLMHAGNPEIASIGPSIMIQYIGIGFFLGIATLMDDGLELALGFHAANNLIICLLVTSSGVAFQTDAIFTQTSDISGSLTESLLSVLVIFPIMLLIFSKKYSWKNWKQQLTKKI